MYIDWFSLSENETRESIYEKLTWVDIIFDLYFREKKTNAFISYMLQQRVSEILLLLFIFTYKLCNSAYTSQIKRKACGQYNQL